MLSTTIRSTLLLCVFLAISHPLMAQSISGIVTDAQTSQPLPGANVLQAETSNGTSADEDGAFQLDLLEGESPQIEVTFIGYQPVTLEVEGDSRPLTIRLVPQTLMSNEVFVNASRADEASPMAFENISRSTIEQRNVGQDMPYMVEGSPSVTTTSDAGAGVGYTGLRIRGVDQGRINVTVNGIPMNDAESHSVFWVNMPDLASSVENIQIQRGVGTSTNGAAAFGATMNLQTSTMRPEAYGEINTAVGSYNTRKANIMLGSGLLDNGWQFEGRLSGITSDGYIDRASSDLKSYYLSGARHGKRSLLRADLFSGQETTYQAWYGISEEQMEENRRFNPAGMEKPGEPYDNQTDNYQQDHYQLHYSYRLATDWHANASLHYTYGRGYYEEYKGGQALSDYSIDPIRLQDTLIGESDLVRRLWLDNHFYGAVFSSEYEADRWSLTFGGGYNEYDGDHFGKVIWARFAGNSEMDDHYYDNNAFKTDFNTYLKGRYHITSRLNAFADAQIRHITYSFLGKDHQPLPRGGQQVVDVQQTDALTFFNPKIGLTYQADDQHRLFASLSVGNKEPTRDEYVDSTPENRPRPERLYDWEAGYKGSFERFSLGANLYWMKYQDQLILTGEINDVGAYVRQNVPESYRAGIELQAEVQATRHLSWKGNVTFSRNKIEEYTFYLDDYDIGGQEALVFRDTEIAFSPGFIGNSILRYSRGDMTAEWSIKQVSRQYLDNTQSHSRSLDPYLKNDLRFSYNWNVLHFMKGITATLQVNNLLDERYESNGYTYGYIEGGEQQFFNYYYPQAGRNFLLQLSFNF